jgi:dTDP-4-amino-4,6-dideoxygalactose transaminase
MPSGSDDYSRRRADLMNTSFVPFHRPSIGDEEIQEVVNTLRSGWLTTGPRTAQFEKEFAAYVQAAHALAVNSGTAALHLALAGLNIGPGDEVITTPLTFCATVNTILQVGATPILADITEDGNINPAAAAKQITSRTRALLPVHLGGLPCDMSAIWDLADTWNLKVIEDAAHAVGAAYGGSPIGSGNTGAGQYSDAVAFSFYATKNLTTGEGGMVTTHNADLAAKMKILCLHGISADAWNRYSDKGNWFYEVVDCGFKYNLSDLQSAIGIHQLRRQEEFVEKRTRIARLYQSALASVDEVELPKDHSASRHAWHLFSIRLNLEHLTITRDELIAELRALGVGTSVHFIPIPLHPAYARYPGLQQETCPIAMSLYRRLLSLPIYPEMTNEEVHCVASRLKTVLHASRKRPLFALGAAV